MLIVHLMGANDAAHVIGITTKTVVFIARVRATPVESGFVFIANLAYSIPALLNNLILKAPQADRGLVAINKNQRAYDKKPSRPGEVDPIG